MPAGSILIGFDGSPASEHAVREAGRLLGPRPAVVVTVWDPGAGFEMAELPVVSADIPAPPIDLRSAQQIDEAVQGRAQRIAQHGTAIAAEAGLEAEALVVADEVTVAETLVRVARERDAQAIVVGAHGHKGITDRIFGSTSQSVVRHAGRPVVVVRDTTE